MNMLICFRNLSITLFTLYFHLVGGIKIVILHLRQHQYFKVIVFILNEILIGTPKYFDSMFKKSTILTIYKGISSYIFLSVHVFQFLLKFAFSFSDL